LRKWEKRARHDNKDGLAYLLLEERHGKNAARSTIRSQPRHCRRALHESGQETDDDSAQTGG